ncbi:hypothetical protein KSB_84450 [Ktedonobacter robiniae]|uniref:HTH IS21-type domain-containing protein n=1 Tax=Ktedonobacter robiniae TaxID=2778365 RepID=A0ABQ3V503_9CHLR|nr:hypothetical protein KSB_84450 [Ktedonobacter robiniae]
MQYADRFHLLKNLRESLEGLLARHLVAEYKQQTQAMLDEQEAPMWQPKRAVKISPALERLQQSRREERLARYEQVIALRKLGLSRAAFARQVGIGASTVQSWLAAGRFPERKPREQASHVDRYLPYLIRRWEDGCHNIADLFQEPVKQGYQGSYESIRNSASKRAQECSFRLIEGPCSCERTTGCLSVSSLSGQSPCRGAGNACQASSASLGG